MEEDGIQLPIVAVNLIMSNVPVSSTEIDPIHEETSKDPTFTLLKHYIHTGWPSEHRMLPQELHMYWNYREDLSMENGLITKGGEDFSHLPHSEGRSWNKYMMDIKE